MLQYAGEHIADAKGFYRQLAGLDADAARAALCPATHRATVQKLLRSCVGIGVAVVMFSREVEAGTASDEPVVVELDRSEGYHVSFPVPLVKRKR